MRERVRQVFAGLWAVPVSEIPEDATPETLAGWDSLRHLELMLELEMTFGVRIPTDLVPELVSIGDIEDALAELGAS